MRKIVIVCGPTASGKTAVGVELARRFRGEIVSADSQQVWRGFDIGTAKPSASEREAVPHHLIDCADPGERFDAARFVELADEAIAGIAARGRVPLVVGGTGMYIRMLIHGFCDAPPRDDDLRAELEKEMAAMGPAALHARLAGFDPASAIAISQNDRTRIVRAIEIYELTGTRPSELRGEHDFSEKRYDALEIGLMPDREELYRGIEARVDRMIAGGLADEARRLLGMCGRDAQPFAAVGYREMASHLRGEIGLEEAARLIKRNSRRLAKRQLTWFRADPEIRWMDPADPAGIEQLVHAFIHPQPEPQPQPSV
ncbi:MAG: tRNA (adenosine(37)-N6)-dimethylallyltransferase MiaA [Proteobacteria bacterium]|nr:tRNA (adenosine(37)-N6)-dimethylallyltransferase MiaA [Pseudomonadota bacterium]